MPTKPIHHDEDNEWVGGQIRTFRKNAKMTQTDLAKGIGVSSQVKCTNFRHKVYQVTVRF